MGKKILKILFGLSLIPFCIGFTWQFAVTVVSVTYRPLFPYYFIGGALLYLAVHLLFKKPILAYVVGHELTHALFAVLFGGAVKAFQASERGGRVTITKSNVIITLAPYFFPLYTAAVLILYWLTTAAGIRDIQGWIVFFSGATFSFHVVLTLVFLQEDQNDIREHGALFSYPLIFLFNVAFAAFLLSVLLAQDMSYLVFVIGGIMKSGNLATSAAAGIYDMLQPLW